MKLLKPKFHVSLKFLMAFCSLFIFSLTSISPSYAQSSVIFTPTVFENNFPISLTFKTHVESPIQIVSAKLIFSTTDNTAQEFVINLQISPSKNLDLKYSWLSSYRTIFPGTPVYYYWVIEDENGNSEQTSREVYYYDDSRFVWDTLANNELKVSWHNRPKSFGQSVLNVATKSIEKQTILFGTELNFQVHIFIYNNDDEFFTWQRDKDLWIGGLTAPDKGITAQVVTDTPNQEVWLNSVIPHEISHIFVFKIEYRGWAFTPAWLNEGIAQLNEFDDKSDTLKDTQNKILRGEYIPLSQLSECFCFLDEKDVNQAYGESYSAVYYLVDTYGQEGLSRLLNAYYNGKQTGEAFRSAFGISTREFEEQWLKWLGVQDASSFISTPTLAKTATPVKTLAPATLVPATTELPPSIKNVSSSSVFLTCILCIFSILFFGIIIAFKSIIKSKARE